MLLHSATNSDIAFCNRIGPTDPEEVDEALSVAVRKYGLPDPAIDQKGQSLEGYIDPSIHENFACTVTEKALRFYQARHEFSKATTK